jgi:hypothetical protein
VDCFSITGVQDAKTGADEIAASAVLAISMIFSRR